MFRRDEDIIGRDMVDSIFRSGIQDVASDWGFGQDDLLKFEDQGFVKQFSADEDLEQYFPKERPESLPPFVPGHEIYERGGKCIGVLDGTSHFIELFQQDHNIDYDQARKRVDRNGQKNPVRFISMIVKNSIDEDIDFILDSKGSNADLILNQLKKRLETNG